MNPFAPPHARVGDTRLSSSRWKAVAVGAAIALGVAHAVLSLFGLGIYWILTLQGVPPQQLYARANQWTEYVVFAHFVSFVCVMVGGYWSARLSPEEPILTALLAGCLLMAFLASGHLAPYDPPIPVWSRVATLLVPVPACVLGALCWQRTSER